MDNLSAANAGTVKVGIYTVNRMGFGAMRITGEGIWGPPDDEEVAKQVLKRAVELEVNFIDTADAYGPEVSENLIHDALSPYEGIIIATKGGMLRGGPGNWRPDGTPKHLREACEASLKRLGVPQITVYQFHRPDPKVAFKDSVNTLIELQQEGKIKHIGLSNVNLEQLQQALKLTPIATVQNHYNFEHRRDSEEVLKFCEQQGIAFIPYFPIGGNQGGVGAAVDTIAGKHNATPRQIALAWLLAHSPAILPIPGTGSIKHLEENIAAATIELDSEDMAALDDLSD
jgi:aryl-alcohol dehydrogenase-like predicted oxidoreductase